MEAPFCHVSGLSDRILDELHGHNAVAVEVHANVSSFQPFTAQCAVFLATGAFQCFSSSQL